MIDLNALQTDIETILSTQPELEAALGNEYLYVGVAETFPSITLDGFYCVDDKQDQYTFNLNLIFKKVDSSFSESAAFYAFADQMKEALHSSNMIVGGDWLDRPEAGFNRALFTCQVWF